MKKIFTLIIVALSSLSALADDYTGQLAVAINGAPTASQQATITANKQADGKYEFQLNDFEINMGGNATPVGNIVLKDVDATTAEDGSVNLQTSQGIKITAGSDPKKNWLGPKLTLIGSIPVTLKATVKDGTFKADITIPFKSLSMDIKVLFNSATTQIANSDFELFHKEEYHNSEDASYDKVADEPNHWHSFLSATGDLAEAQNAFSNGVHTASSDDVRPGTKGKSSILVKATSVFGIVANGTITTGRMNAGGMIATDKSNHAFLDITNEDKDANGDLFYTLLGGQPDSLSVWVKFKQATATPEHPYATVNAVITDGTRYQDPEDKAYTNVVAKATDTKIAAEDKWVRLSIPFDYAKYAANKADTKAILVTISTNADPGQGSDGDELYVDDLELVYTPKLQGIKVFGNAVDDFDPATTEYTIKVPQDPTISDVTPVAVNGFTTLAYANKIKKTVTVVVYSEDLTKSTSYTVKYTIDKNVTNGIDNATATADKKVVGIYNLNGQQVSQKQPGQVYVIKYSDGTAAKELSK